MNTSPDQKQTAHTAIPGYDGYFVSDDGSVWSALGWRGKGYLKLKYDLDLKGYPSLRLKLSDGKRKRLRVHRIVAAAFLPPRPSFAHEVRHLNGDKTDNRASNLAWGTRAENAADREMHGRTSRGETHSQAIKRGLEDRHV